MVVKKLRRCGSDDVWDDGGQRGRRKEKMEGLTGDGVSGDELKVASMTTVVWVKSGTMLRWWIDDSGHGSRMRAMLGSRRWCR